MDLISRRAAIDALTEYWNGISERHPTLDGEMAVYADCKGIIKRLPSVAVQSDMKRSFVEYVPFVTAWLMDYQVKSAKLMGRYTAYEVIGWLVNDWMKENPERPDEP